MTESSIGSGKAEGVGARTPTAVLGIKTGSLKRLFPRKPMTPVPDRPARLLVPDTARVRARGAWFTRDATVAGAAYPERAPLTKALHPRADAGRVLR